MTREAGGGGGGREDYNGETSMNCEPAPSTTLSAATDMAHVMSSIKIKPFLQRIQDVPG